MSKRVNNFKNLLESSEMVCSLKYEDARGCPYGSFTPRSIAVLSTAGAFLAIVSLLVGM